MSIKAKGVIVQIGYYLGFAALVFLFAAICKDLMLIMDMQPEGVEMACVIFAFIAALAAIGGAITDFVLVLVRRERAFLSLFYVGAIFLAALMMMVGLFAEWVYVVAHANSVFLLGLVALAFHVAGFAYVKFVQGAGDREVRKLSREVEHLRGLAALKQEIEEMRKALGGKHD